jgi:DNA-binding MarR family transcriptional regulator
MATERQEQFEALLGAVRSLASRLRVDRSEINGGTLQLLARHGPQTVPQIARLRATSRQNIQIQVNRLERDGHVELTSNPVHKRSELVRVTDSGKMLSESLHATQRHTWEKLEPLLSAAEMTSAAALLRQIHDLITQEEAEGELASQRGIGQLEAASQTAKGERPGPGREEPESDEEFPINLL